MTAGDTTTAHNGIKLLILATVAEAYAIWFRNFWTWISLIVLPSIVAVIGIVMLAGTIESLPGELRGFVRVFLSCLVLVPMMTGWHRLVLIEAGPVRKLRAIGRREWRYLRYVILIFAAAFSVFIVNFLAVAGLLGAVSEPGSYIVAAWMLLLVGIVFYAFVAVSPVLPAAATGGPLSLKRSWQATRGHRWPTLFMFVLAAVPLAGIGIAIGFFAGPVGADLNPYISAYLHSLTYYAMTLIALPPAIAVASICYRELVQKPEAAGSTHTR